jgi:Cu2+-exporting ATPase
MHNYKYGTMQNPSHTNHDHHEHHHGHEHHHVDEPTGGHDKHAGHHVADFLKRFIVCSILTIPVLILSHMIQKWVNFELSFPGDKYVLAVAINAGFLKRHLV